MTQVFQHDELAQILLRSGVINEEQLEEARQIQQREGKSLDEALLDSRMVDKGATD